MYFKHLKIPFGLSQNNLCVHVSANYLRETMNEYLLLACGAWPLKKGPSNCKARRYSQLVDGNQDTAYIVCCIMNY